jgi:hypothetical protein
VSLLCDTGRWTITHTTSPKRIALPILHHELQFDTYNQFRKAISSFFAAHQRGDPVFSWIRSLTFKRFEWDIRPTERRMMLRDTEDLIARTPNLETVWFLHHRLPSSSLLTALGTSCSQSLRGLAITIDQSTFPGLHAINHLRLLDSLSVLVVSSNWPTTDTEPWSFPSLLDMVWLRKDLDGANPTSGSGQDIHFLDKSHFGSLRDVSTSFAARADQEQSKAFESFLKKQPELERVHFVGMPDSSDLIQSLIPYVTVRELRLELCDMPSGTYAILPPCVRVLYLQVGTTANFESLEEMVNKILHGEAEPKLEAIHLEWEGNIADADFSWIPQPGESELIGLIRQLFLSWWQLLYYRSVQVFDERGQTPLDCGLKWFLQPDLVGLPNH